MMMLKNRTKTSANPSARNVPNESISIPAAETNASSETAYSATAKQATGPGKENIVNQQGEVMDIISKTPNAAAEVKASPAELGVLMAEVRYGIVFGEMNEMFNGHVHRCLLWIGYASVALSVTGVLQTLTKIDQSFVPIWTLFCLVASALAFTAQKAFGFKDKEAQFKTAKAAFQRLEGIGWGMSEEVLMKAIAKLHENAPSGGSWVAPLAYNRACNELGYSDSDFQMEVPTRAKIAWRFAEWA